MQHCGGDLRLKSSACWEKQWIRCRLNAWNGTARCRLRLDSCTSHGLRRSISRPFCVGIRPVSHGGIEIDGHDECMRVICCSDGETDDVEVTGTRSQEGCEAEDENRNSADKHRQVLFDPTMDSLLQ